MSCGRALAAALLLVSVAATAEVVSKGETGFNLRIVGEANVRPMAAYDQFLDVSEWWIESHTWFGNAGSLSIEPQAGGCFCEISGNRQVMHMLVTFVEPGVEIRLVGGLGPLQMMGIHGGMSWRFEKSGTGTRIVQTYNVTGYAPDGLAGLADVVDRVQTDQLNALVARLSSPDSD